MSRQIVFVEGVPTIVSYKIAKALKRRGNEVVLISFLKFDKTFYDNAYDKIICFDLDSFSKNFKNIIKITKKIPFIIKRIIEIKKLNPYAVIGTANPYPLWLPALIRKFVKKRPFIFFPYDVNILRFNEIESYKKAGIKNFEMKFEKYLYKKSDGIMFKGIENSFVKNKFKLDCPVINFPPYCDKEFITKINKNKLSKKDNEIHLVYIGDIEISDNKQTLGMGSWRDSIKKILAQKIHLHIYTPRHKEMEKSEEYQDFMKNPYLHVYPSLGPKEIIHEISKYDYGLWFCNYDFNIINYEFASLIGANKVASYLEAGIPIIFTDELEYMRAIMKKYNLDIHISNKSKNKIREMINELNYKNLISRVKLARRDFEMNKQICQLENFIDKLAENLKEIK